MVFLDTIVSTFAFLVFTKYGIFRYYSICILYFQLTYGAQSNENLNSVLLNVHR